VHVAWRRRAPYISVFANAPMAPEVLEEILEDQDRAWVRGYLGEQRRR
jgi:hypothetical protein